MARKTTRKARGRAAPQKSAKNGALTYSAAFEAMDLIDDAVIDIEGTFRIFSQIVEAMPPEAVEGGWFITLERHFEADRQRLEDHIKKARAAILGPLFKATARPQ